MIFLDRNECLANGTGCHANATCVNFDGGHRCVCNKGYYGNGTNCTGKWNINFLRTLYHDYGLWKI